MPSEDPAAVSSEVPASAYDLSKFFDYSGRNCKSVAIFCWSRTEENTKLWNDAETLGRYCAEHGFSVITGGYCGSMEAVSKGARHVVDQQRHASCSDAVSSRNAPEVIGILVPGQFPDRKLVGNPYLTKSVDAETFPRRVEILCSMSRYYVILPGTLGTLQELTQIWILSLLHPAALDRPLIIAFRDPWEKLLQTIAESLNLPANNMELITFADTPEDVIRIINDDHSRRNPRE